MIIKCTMREGITEADIEGFRYTFRPDAAGNPLCSVTKEGHIQQLLRMGSHCYVQYVAKLPYEQMSAVEILALPDGEAEDHKARIREDQAKADKIDAQKAADAAKSPEARQSEFEDRIEAVERKQAAEAPAVTTSAAADLAETRIRELIQSFKTLSKKRFESWIENNRDQVAAMPADVKVELAKKINKYWPDKDPDIPGLDLEKYATSTDATNKGHSNNE